ncbi:MAG TPA: GWxTD domain-containing protein [Gemmatimonadales bacterium]|nr:GWxTD domain-containing protein [Gemmatimonadales bacterium]
MNSLGWMAGIVMLVTASAPAGAQAPATTLPDSAADLHAALALVDQAVRNHDRGPLDESLRRFAAIAQAHPDWPAPWIELGRAKLALFDGGFPAKEGPYQRLGTDYLQGAGNAFLRALDADPGNAVAASLLGATVLREVVQPQTGPALNALRRAAALTPTPSTLLPLAILERQSGNDSASASALRQYLTVGGDSGIGAIELATTLFNLGQRSEAESLYYAGARHAGGAAVRDRYRTDLRWIANPAELAGYDSLPAGDVSGWLREFWNRRDASEGRKLGDRLAEHYRRLAYVLANFRTNRSGNKREISSGNDPNGSLRDITSATIVLGDQETAASREERPLGGTAATLAGLGSTPNAVYAGLMSGSILIAYSSEQNLIDDRGVIYMRYGEPTQRATYHGPAVDPNESWKYLTPSGELIFHFVGNIAPSRLVNQLVFFPPLYASRAILDPRYDLLAFDLQHRGRAAPPEELEEDRQINAEAIRIGTTTDAFPLAFDNRLDAVAQAYGLAHLPGAPSGALVSFAVRAEHLAFGQDAASGLSVYPIRVRILAENLTNGRVVEHDSLRAFANRVPLTNRQYLTGQSVLPLAPGHYAVRVVLADTTGKDGVALLADTVSVPSSASSHLTLSDVVIGREGSAQTVAIPPERIPLNPLGAVPEGTTVTLYYQAAGLTPGKSYHARLELRRRFGDRDKDRLNLSFTERAVATAASYHRTVDLRNLRPGAYQLRLLFEAPDGTTIERRQELNVVKR